LVSSRLIPKVFGICSGCLRARGIGLVSAIPRLPTVDWLPMCRTSNRLLEIPRRDGLLLPLATLPRKGCRRGPPVMRVAACLERRRASVERVSHTASEPYTLSLPILALFLGYGCVAAAAGSLPSLPLSPRVCHLSFRRAKNLLQPVSSPVSKPTDLCFSQKSIPPCRNTSLTVVAPQTGPLHKHNEVLLKVLPRETEVGRIETAVWFPSQDLVIEGVSLRESHSRMFFSKVRAVPRRPNLAHGCTDCTRPLHAHPLCTSKQRMRRRARGSRFCDMRPESGVAEGGGSTPRGLAVEGGS